MNKFPDIFCERFMMSKGYLSFPYGMPLLRVFSPLLILMYFTFVTETGFAYTAHTHEILVGKSFEYMEQQESDYQDILNQWPSGMHEDLQLREILMAGANAADSRTDLYYHRTTTFGKVMGFLLGIDECFQQLNIPFAYDGHFTAMQHFLVIPGGPGKIWPHDGYSYQTSDKKGDDFWAFAFPLVYYSGVKIDTEKCGFELPKWFHWDVSANKEPHLINNFKQEIPYIAYPPATSVAGYDYSQFLQDVAQDFPRPSPHGLEALARVLHLSQDMTVPHHVIGLLGSGHAEYEQVVENWVKTRADLINMNTISEHLQKRRCFDLKCPLHELFYEIGRYTLTFEEASGRINKDRKYLPDLDNDQEAFARAHELINLAIASNIVLLKMAWEEWSQTHSQQAWIRPVRRGSRTGKQKYNEPEHLKGMGPKEKQEFQNKLGEVFHLNPNPKVPFSDMLEGVDVIDQIKKNRKQVDESPREFFSPGLSKLLPPDEDILGGVARKFRKLDFEQFLHFGAVPNRLKPFKKVMRETQELISKFVASPEMSSAGFRRDLLAKSAQLEQIMRKIPFDEIKEGFKNSSKKAKGKSSGNLIGRPLRSLKEAMKKRVYESMKLCGFLVVFYAVLRAFPLKNLDHKSVRGKKQMTNYRETMDEVKIAFKMFARNVKTFQRAYGR